MEVTLSQLFEKSFSHILTNAFYNRPFLLTVARAFFKQF